MSGKEELYLPSGETLVVDVFYRRWRQQTHVQAFIDVVPSNQKLTFQFYFLKILKILSSYVTVFYYRKHLNTCKCDPRKMFLK